MSQKKRLSESKGLSELQKMSINVNINFDYLDRVRKIATLYTKRKTSDLFDGDYHSRQHGRSLDFDDLREYHYGDDVSMIDWKSSSRVGKTLIRRYFADRRLNVIFVGDTGRKMTGDTPAGESKEQIALMALGITAYLVGEQGATYALSCCGQDGQRITPFLTGAGHLEELIYTYKESIENKDSIGNNGAFGNSGFFGNKVSLGKKAANENKDSFGNKDSIDRDTPSQSFRETLLKTASSFSRHMIMVIITDREGLAEMDKGLVKRLTYYNDVYVFCIEDAFLTSDNAFDLDADRFADPFLAICEDLRQEELQIRTQLEQTAESILTPNRIFFKKISREEEIVDALVWLFGRRRGTIT